MISLVGSRGIILVDHPLKEAHPNSMDASFCLVNNQQWRFAAVRIFS